MGYAFISYSTKNQASADAMRELFKKHNIDTWMAPYDIPAGSEYAEVLYDTLIGCSCLVLMLTDVSQNSQWVRKEVNIAITNGKTVIPVQLEEVELNSSMKFYLIDQQIVPVHIIEEKSIEIQNILNSVISITGKNITSFKSIIDVSHDQDDTIKQTKKETTAYVDGSNEVIDENFDSDDVELTIEQQTRLHACVCGHCGMFVQIKRDSTGYRIKCSHCEATGVIEESIDATLDNWDFRKEETIVEDIVDMDTFYENSNKEIEERTDVSIDKKYELIDGETIIKKEGIEPKVKVKGHLVNSYRRVIVLAKDDCVHPIEICMPDNTIKVFDFCDEFVVNNQKKYIVACQKNDTNEYLFFVFRSRNGKNTLVSEGSDQKKVYRLFREKYKDEYLFTDENAISKSERKRKHFAQDTAQRYFATAEDIPQILILPDKYEHISANAFAKLNPNGKEIRQIIISDKVEVVEDNAFAGLVVTEAVHIPASVKKVGDSAFTLKKEAYVYFSARSRTAISYSRNNVSVILDKPYERTVAYEVDQILDEIAQCKNITRIKNQALPCRTPPPLVDEIVIPKGVCVIDNSAFGNIRIKKRVVIPNSVTRIGQCPFELLSEAYVECDKDSYAYLYCKENGVRNSVDISNYYRSKGVCAYCGGKFTGLFKKKCSFCEKEKDY